MSYQEFESAIKALNLSQPDARTCQSACIGMAVRDPDIQGIRRRLTAVGTAGDPYVMGKVIKEYGVNYKFDDNASLSEVRDWLRNGEFLITHGWFTGSGHVICLDGVAIDMDTLGYKLNVKDPWSEFDGASWSYKYQSTFYDGYYSSRMIYAACVRGISKDNAAYIYRKGELNSSLKGAWIHRIIP